MHDIDDLLAGWILIDVILIQHLPGIINKLLRRRNKYHPQIKAAVDEYALVNSDAGLNIEITIMENRAP
jgi:hypothetical protein